MPLGRISARVTIYCTRDKGADTPHTLALLCARRERPRSGAAEKRDERAALHSITSSAVDSSDGGTVRPSILAVWWLMTRPIYNIGSRRAHLEREDTRRATVKHS